MPGMYESTDAEAREEEKHTQADTRRDETRRDRRQHKTKHTREWGIQCEDDWYLPPRQTRTGSAVELFKDNERGGGARKTYTRVVGFAASLLWWGELAYATTSQLQ